MIKYIRSIYLICLLTLVLGVLAAFCLVLFRLLVYSTTSFDFISNLWLILYPLMCIVSLHFILHGFVYFLIYSVALILGIKTTHQKFIPNIAHCSISFVLWYILRSLYFFYVHQVLVHTSTEALETDINVAQKALLTLQSETNSISVGINVLSSITFLVCVVVFLLFIGNVLTILSKRGAVE